VNSALHRGVGDSRTVIAAGCGHDSSRRDVPHQKIGKGAARLERTRMLQLLELQRQRAARRTKIGRVAFEHRRAPDVRADKAVGHLNAATIDNRFHRSTHFPLPP